MLSGHLGNGDIGRVTPGQELPLGVGQPLQAIFQGRTTGIASPGRVDRAMHQPIDRRVVEGGRHPLPPLQIHLLPLVSCQSPDK